MDSDAVVDEVIGSLVFDLNDYIHGNRNEEFFWANIYGAPLNQKKNEYYIQMSENPEMASMWKGRILMQI